MMHVYEDHGVVIQDEERILIDPHRKKVDADRIFVSHAHSDHVHIGAKNPSTYYMTHLTHGLVEKKIPQAAYSEKLHLNAHLHGKQHKISFVNSGHILGSAQIVVEGEKKVCVTTDMKLQDSIIQQGAEIVPCDILVIESTFGKKEFSFPEREVVYAQMGKWLKHAQQQNFLPILQGYATGKAQELTKIVNEYSSAIPFVHANIFEKNTIARAHGHHIGKFERIDHNLKDAEVLILPPNLCDYETLHAISVSAKKSVVTGIATGWPSPSNAHEAHFALSDHADYDQLMNYVGKAEPKQVFTDHGFSRELAIAIQKEFKIPARPLEEAKQLVLAHY
jgi:putative mRNA 3-end processing factor